MIIEILKPEKPDSATTLKGLDYVDVPGLSKRDYRLNFFAHKEGAFSAKVGVITVQNTLFVGVKSPQIFITVPISNCFVVILRQSSNGAHGRLPTNYQPRLLVLNMKILYIIVYNCIVFLCLIDIYCKSSFYLHFNH